MSNLFKHVACFTDIHYGNKHNSRTHNNDCEEFVTWFIQEAKARGCETCIFLGDWHHHRSNVNVSTLNYTMSGLRMLNDAFDKVYIITGNHDLFYREKREIHSLIMGQEFNNIEIVDEKIVSGDVAIVPWLVEDEWKSVKKIKTKYMFGHFEIPGFKMNALVEMPDHGQINRTHFQHQEYVFSGHFHKRQQSDNVHYIGNPFGHNYADAWDDERGMMVLEWGGKPKYIDFAGPRYRTVSLSRLIDEPDEILNDKTYCRATLDISISYEEASFIKETFSQQYGVREITLMPTKKEEHAQDWRVVDDIEVENVDQIVYNSLNAVDSEMIDKKLLVEIYNNL